MAGVGVLGVGKVGKHLVEHLVDDGAEVVVSDVDSRAVAAVEHANPSVRVARTAEELLVLAFVDEAIAEIEDPRIADVMRDRLAGWLARRRS